ncbi:MAG: DUF1540 domain-containing protein [Oscillospiraceae bacterium]
MNNNQEKCISCVNCSVTGCTYHTGSNCCSAAHISVSGNTSANGETRCQTFTPKGGCC